MHGPQNTLMLWQCIIARTKECFEGYLPSLLPKTIYRIAWGVVARQSDVSAQDAIPHVGHWGAISSGNGHGEMVVVCIL